MDLSNAAKNQSLKPTVPTNNTVVPLPPEAVPRLLPDVFFAPLRVILETADITRQGHRLDDLPFALLGVWRARQASANGRDFLQTHALPLVPELTRSNYFAALSVRGDSPCCKTSPGTGALTNSPTGVPRTTCSSAAAKAEG